MAKKHGWKVCKKKKSSGIKPVIKNCKSGRCIPDSVKKIVNDHPKGRTVIIPHTILSSASSSTETTSSGEKE